MFGLVALSGAPISALRAATPAAPSPIQVSKLNQYSVVTPPTNQAAVTKALDYVVATPPTNQARIPKVLLYVVVTTAQPQRAMLGMV